jgi:hypothetical protein
MAKLESFFIQSEDTTLAGYRFFVNEEPHMSWEGYICKAWKKIKTIDGFFFGGFNTVFFSEINHLSKNDCWRTQTTKLCGDNKMIEDGGQLSFTSTPNGEVVRIKKKTFKSENYMIQKIIMKKRMHRLPNNLYVWDRKSCTKRLHQCVDSTNKGSGKRMQNKRVEKQYRYHFQTRL